MQSYESGLPITFRARVRVGVGVRVRMRVRFSCRATGAVSQSQLGRE